MSKFGMFQIIGAAITTIGLMFLIITGMSQVGLLPIPPIGLGVAIVSLLMATNGYLILLFGVMTGSRAAKNVTAVPTVGH